MKKIYFLLVLLFPLTVFAQWNWLAPSPQGNGINDMLFVGNKGIQVGFRGSIVLSEDAGENWICHETFTNNNLESVCKTGSNTFFIAGSNSTLLKSVDGGYSWNWINVPVTTDLTQVFFVNENTGFCTGKNGKIIKTTDGGENWSLIYSSDTFELNSVCFADENNGIAVGKYNVILRTTDGGLTWNQADCFFPMYFKLKKVTFTSSTVGYIIGDMGFVIRSTDGGATWNLLDPVYYSGDLIDMRFTDANNGFILSRDGVEQSFILKTTDGGNSWHYNHSAFSGLTCIALNNNDVFFASSRVGDILKSSDKGLTFENLKRGINKPLESAFFPDEQTGYVCGSWGAMLKTSDAGYTWDTLTLGGENYRDLYFFTPQKGMVLSMGGLLWKTENGGTYWTTQSLDTNNGLISITFTDNLHGYICGNQGKYLSTNDGGETWTAKWFSQYLGLYKVRFTSIDTGFMVGYEGGKSLIMRTIDKGLTWETMETHEEPIVGLWDICKAPSGKIFAVGSNKTMLVSNDGGTTWIKITTIDMPGCDLTSISFTDNNLGFATSSCGYFIGSADGGETWQQIDIPAQSWLSDVVFTNTSTGYIVGSGGTILKTNPTELYLDVKKVVLAKEDQFKVYPNPCRDNIILEKEDHIPFSAKVVIQNLSGMKVYSEKIRFKEKIIIPVKGLVAGIYFITIIENNSITTKKIIKLNN